MMLTSSYTFGRAAPTAMTRHLLPTGDLLAARSADPRRLSLLSLSLAMALGLVSVPADALTLGRLNVQSALGEPLRAEIDVTEITTAEAEAMKVSIASASAFNAAGVAYNPALAEVRVLLQRRADGRYVVRLSGNRPLNDPFVDLLLEANWNAGRIVRDYTVLLDPPTRRQANATPIAPIAPQTSAAQRAPAAAPSAAPQVAQTAPPVAVAPAAAPTPRQRAVAPPAPPVTPST